MRSIIIIIATLFLVLEWGISQTNTPPLVDTTGLTIDVLKVPNSPAANLLGISPNLVEEPQTPSDFVASIRNATNNFTTLPQNYAFDLAPAWLFGKSKIDYNEFISNSLAENIKQSFVVSLGVNTNTMLGTSTEMTQVGLGGKISLLRGKVDNEFDNLNDAYQLMANLNDSLRNAANLQLSANQAFTTLEDSLKTIIRSNRNDPRIPLLETQIQDLVQKINKDSTYFETTIANQSQLVNQIKAKTAQLKFNRVGFKLDLAGGVVWDFTDQVAKSQQLSRTGIWLTGGWVIPLKQNVADNIVNVSEDKKWSILGTLRLLGNPAQLYLAPDSTLATADNLYFDYGGRLNYNNGGNFTISAEVLGRNVINNDALENGIRYTLNIHYQVSKNILLTGTYGKDFNGYIEEEGNLLTALQLFALFGKKKYDNQGKSSF